MTAHTTLLKQRQINFGKLHISFEGKCPTSISGANNEPGSKYGQISISSSTRSAIIIISHVPATNHLTSVWNMGFWIIYLNNETLHNNSSRPLSKFQSQQNLLIMLWQSGMIAPGPRHQSVVKSFDIFNSFINLHE